MTSPCKVPCITVTFLPLIQSYYAASAKYYQAAFTYEANRASPLKKSTDIRTHMGRSALYCRYHRMLRTAVERLRYVKVPSRQGISTAASIIECSREGKEGRRGDTLVVCRYERVLDVNSNHKFILITGRAFGVVWCFENGTRLVPSMNTNGQLSTRTIQIIRYSKGRGVSIASPMMRLQICLI